MMMNPVTLEKIAKDERQRNEARIKALHQEKASDGARCPSLKISAHLRMRIAKFLGRYKRLPRPIEPESWPEHGK